MNKKLKELLYLSFDSELTDEEQKLLDKSLLKLKELRIEKAELDGMRNTISDGKTKAFGNRFADRVMDRIDLLDSPQNESEFFFRSLLRSFKPAAIVGATAVIVFSSINLYRGNDLSLSSVLGIYEQSESIFTETPLESFLGE